ncbi:MAG: alpha/beta hydrolase [Gemmatimonadaceae bacterium]|nr:alpha/beta hydrolase [Gemmatimonadaceae bacterium]MBA3644642.1 alpha/beta hydrolase [Gemmatimonadaceae bacterium]
MPQPIPPPREEGYTSTTAVPLYWAAYGNKGAPRLLVLHGGPGAEHCYLLPQLLHLGAEYDLLFYDQRGGGKSNTGATDPISWQTQVEDLSAVVREFSLERPSIVAYSFGALITLKYLTESYSHPGMAKPKRLVLLDPAPLTREYRKVFEDEFSRRNRAPEILRMREELNASGLRENDPAAYRQRAFELGVAGYFADPRRANDLTPFRVVGRVQQSVWESLGDFDIISALKKADFPVLIVHGSDDPIPVASSTQAAERLRAQLVVLDDCGHVPYVEQPIKLFTAVDAFLAETE